MDTEKDSEQEISMILKPDGRFESEEDRGGPIFVPPLYMQRYFYVQQELQKRGVTSVVDFGSAECKISKYLVRVPSLEKIALVDIDGALLEKNKHQVKPQACDYLNKRDKSLTVQIYEGSVTQLDEAVVDYEAVSMVEIIEHLYPDILEAACDMIFGGIQPKLIIVTTPNADFNQLFPNFTGFRHWDHKFEWTRKEFEDWANHLTVTFPYSVTFSGVGEPPTDSADLGNCSQSAVFTRCSNYINTSTNIPVTKIYKLVKESIYPHKQNVETTYADSLLQEIEYLIRQMSVYDQCEVRCEENVKELNCESNCEENMIDSLCESKLQRGDTVKERKFEDLKRKDVTWEENVKCLVPLTYFLKFNKFKVRFNMSQLRMFLQDHGYRLSSDGQYIIIYDEYLSDSESDDNDDLVQTENSETPGTQAVLAYSENQGETESENWD